MIKSIQRSSKFMSLYAAFAVLGLMVLASSLAHAQNRVDLEDLTIQGELLDDNRLRLSSREAHEITERVNYRENFRKEIIDHLEVAWPDSDRKPAGADQ